MNLNFRDKNLRCMVVLNFLFTCFVISSCKVGNIWVVSYFLTAVLVGLVYGCLMTLFALNYFINSDSRHWR